MNRRTFIKNSALVAGGLTVLPSFANAAYYRQKTLSMIHWHIPANENFMFQHSVDSHSNQMIE